MDLARRLSRGIQAIFAANLVTMLAKAGLLLLLTRVLLTPEQYGELNFALSVLGGLAILATLGLPKSAARYVTEFAEQRPGMVPHVIVRSLGFLLFFTLLIAGGTALFGGEVAVRFGAPSFAPVVGVGALFIAATALSAYTRQLFQAFNSVEWSGVVGIISGLSRLLFVALFVWLGYGVAGALFGYVVALAVGVLVGGVVLYRRFYSAYEPDVNPDASISRRILEYSVPLTATRSANVIDKKVDTVLVGVIVDMTAVGFYTIGKAVSDFVSMPASSLGYTISPALSEQRSKGSEDRAARIYETTLHYVLLAYVPAVAGLILVAEPMVQYVFGSGYDGAAPVVQIFGLFVLANAVNKVTSDGLDYLGRARSRAIVKTIMALSNVLLNLLLIPTMGVVGAAVATVITFSFYTLANLYIIHQELPLHPRDLVGALGNAVAVTLGMSIVVWLTLPYVSGIPTLIGAVVLGVVTWAALSIAGGVLDPNEVARLLG
ncbi:oligosaccharide flippase family protein [Halobaculum sp. WSA2]|uniref:Oligosaccharide flippase family protein n=1 Tax=Halobaculum saliterrae TaxID=2073113 RepID=A0A6B0SS05_9EURY|nr:flippase [Halobaculum saliterrae]MXR40366.1 oligosaccharide flippase family protein [Halobaculum saliterrae]